MGTNTLWEMAERHLGTEIGQSEKPEALNNAARKLQRIIELFGDDDGMRLEPDYMAQLIAEAVKSSRLMQYTLAADSMRR